MGQPSNEEVESLLKPDVRARLSFRRLLLLYLHPFALFKDASRGPVEVRERALTYNRTMRWMLIAYLRRWATIATSLFVGIEPAQALAAGTSLAVIPAALLAVGCCIAVVVMVCTGTSYLLLGTRS